MAIKAKSSERTGLVLCLDLPETGAQVAEFYAEPGRKGVNGSFRGAKPPAAPFPASPPTLTLVR